MRIEDAIDRLVAAGYQVTVDDWIPGLYRIDNGPELTTGQVIQIAERLPRTFVGGRALHSPFDAIED